MNKRDSYNYGWDAALRKTLERLQTDGNVPDVTVQVRILADVQREAPIGVAADIVQLGAEAAIADVVDSVYAAMQRLTNAIRAQAIPEVLDHYRIETMGSAGPTPSSKHTSPSTG